MENVCRVEVLLILKTRHGSFTQPCSLCTDRRFANSPQTVTVQRGYSTPMLYDTDVCDRAHLEDFANFSLSQDRFQCDYATFINSFKKKDLFLFHKF